MSKNTTDTNQASEDELRVLVDETLSEYSLHPQQTHMDECIFWENEEVCSCSSEWEFKQYPKFLEDLTAKLHSLIRTEKLKLLAEVRERVVGENFKNWGELETDEQAIQAYANRLKDDQRVKLTKLEAEL